MTVVNSREDIADKGFGEASVRSGVVSAAEITWLGVGGFRPDTFSKLSSATARRMKDREQIMDNGLEV